MTKPIIGNSSNIQKPGQKLGQNENQFGGKKIDPKQSTKKDGPGGKPAINRPFTDKH